MVGVLITYIAIACIFSGVIASAMYIIGWVVIDVFMYEPPHNISHIDVGIIVLLASGAIYLAISGMLELNCDDWRFNLFGLHKDKKK